MTLTEAYKFDDLTVLLKEVATYGWNDDLKFKAPAFIRKYAVTVSNDIILLDQRLYIPPQLVQIILESLHGMHESDGYMIKVAKTKYVFQNFSTLIKQFYLSCSICMTYRKNSKKKVTTWSPTSIPRERYCLDYFTFEGHNFLTVVDDFSFFINCFKVKSMDSDTLVKTLIKAFNNMGTPYACVSDNFKSFKCSKYVQFMEEIGVQVIYSIPYQSNTNGKAEKAVDVLKSAMLKLVKDKDYKRTIHECMDMAIQKNHRTVRTKMIDGREITKTIEQFFFNTIILSEDQINKHFFQPIKMEETIKFKLHPDDKEWVNGITFEKCSPHTYKILDDKGLVHVRKEHEINFLQRKMKENNSTYKFSSQKEVMEHLSQNNYECIIASDGSCLKGKGTGFIINHNGKFYAGGRPYFKNVTAQYLEVQSIYDCLLVMKSLQILSLKSLWMIDSQYVCMCLRRLTNWKEQEFILCNKKKANAIRKMQ
uniref:Integrase catalytic domain-containing protein n=1 Tax=Strongyloides papillosus TaxID=174720 RepID=A0A0N5BYT1_STREA